MWWGGDDLGTLAVSRSGFDLRFHAQSIDTDILARVFIRDYSVNGDSVRRIEPVAMSPRDFVDEWIVAPWPESAAWSAPSNLGKLHLIHQQLAQLHSQGDTDFGFRSARRCANAPATYQIELGRDNGAPFYFRVNGDTSSFMMMKISNTADPGCSGKDILDTMVN